ncbi:hypothetical protein TNCV_4826291 [Trichonephila clavipes]|uniref:Uncharacterized protein n=1 Tax=Trichonephila clavipes TaxID=2585209 RepID=A0A8X6RJA2_TRICX|nr:hypothetical protein TNCV_4826291 [Trichonephila clavipes]
MDVCKWKVSLRQGGTINSRQVASPLVRLVEEKESGRDSLVAKVTDSCPACHEFQPSAAEDPPYRGAMRVKSVEAQTSSRWCGVEVRRGKC